MSTQRILAQLDRLSTIVEHHNHLLTILEANLPQHDSTIAALRQQFEAHISFLLVNLKSYTTLQQSITSTIRDHPEHIEITTAFVVPSPIAAPAELPTSLRRHPRSGNYPYYAVRAGRTTGIFTSWPDCFQATKQRRYQRFSRFRFLDLSAKVSQPLGIVMAPAHSKLTIHPWLDAPLYN
jgi:hypothetical protein